MEAELDWECLFNHVFKFCNILGRAFKNNIPLDMTVWVLVNPSDLKTDYNLSLCILGFIGAIPRRNATYLGIFPLGDAAPEETAADVFMDFDEHDRYDE